MAKTTGLVAGLVLGVLACGAAHGFTPGGGPADTDCLAEFDGTPAVHPPANPREIRCTDNDPACDDDPTLGSCRFHVRVCFNVTDPARPTCVHRDLEDYAVENAQPDTNPLHDFDFQTLEDAVTFVTMPVAATEADVCSPNASMAVPLGIRLFSGGGTWKKGKKTLRTTARGPGGIFDGDKLAMTCLPATGTGPCDGVTSTFDQIQQHVFNQTCARSTCHNIAQGAHQMSLAPGQAYADLVGVAPNNAAAAAVGKLRVDPGNPANSFILDKLRGALAAGEGERMPRGLKRLKPVFVQLVEEWIAAGAPATGLVSAVGCH